MNVYYNTDSIPTLKNPTITIGTFDGVHTGHRFVIDTLVKKAREINGESVIITFEPHPRLVISSNKNEVFILNTLDEKIKNLETTGVDHVVVVKFDMAFASMTAEEYIEQFLVKYFHPKIIMIGQDHQFGKGRKGNIQLLKQYETQYQYHVEEIPLQIIEQKKVSSTQVRNFLKMGDVAQAAQLLGSYYTLQGEVCEGRKLGRTLGFPTANLSKVNQHKLIPAYGVYVVKVNCNGNTYFGMMNIGTNPTVTNDTSPKFEVHIFDFNQNIYHETISIFFIERLRDELKFDSVEAMVIAIQKDKQLSLDILSKIKN